MIVSDYAVPAALMVPHGPWLMLETLEAIAEASAHAVGVILLSQDPAMSERFVSNQPDPARFSIVAAEFDTPWIQDRSPVAVRVRRGYRWVVPEMESQRPLDDTLFSRAIARDTESIQLIFMRGNLIGGPRGVAISTTQILDHNGMVGASDLTGYAKRLGIKRWLLVPPFEHEMSGHIDVCARFLSPRLVAVAWNPDDETDQLVAAAAEREVCTAVPGLRVVRLPMRTRDTEFASPVNWIQLGRLLLIPRYPITPDDDVNLITNLLTAEGFRPRFIDSPTTEYGGSLHCLTASIYA